MFFLIAILFFIFPAEAQILSLDMGEGASTTGRLFQLFAVVTVLSLAPSIVMMVTSFTRIAIVLSFLRSAMGLQQTPPNAILLSLALFLTVFIMGPTFEEAYEKGIKPLINEQIQEEEAFDVVSIPFKKFMLRQVREKDLKLFIDVTKIDKIDSPDETPMKVLIPAFMISELRRAFEIGFLIFIPFLIIDMVVASILMAMGMMMVPPIMIALPFKLIFFVLVDGWHMIVGSLIQSFN